MKTELEKIAEELTEIERIDFPEGFIENPGDWEDRRYVRQTEKGQERFLLQYSKIFRTGNYATEYTKREEIKVSDLSYSLTATYHLNENYRQIEITPKMILAGVDIARKICSYDNFYLGKIESINFVLPNNDSGNDALKKLITHIFRLPHA